MQIRLLTMPVSPMIRRERRVEGAIMRGAARVGVGLFVMIGLFTTIVGLVSPAVATQATQLRAARPVDPIAAIVDAFRTHDIVAMGRGTS
jgi:hypothetical protein